MSKGSTPSPNPAWTSATIYAAFTPVTTIEHRPLMVIGDRYGAAQPGSTFMPLFELNLCPRHFPTGPNSGCPSLTQRNALAAVTRDDLFTTREFPMLDILFIALAAGFFVAAAASVRLLERL
jgi:hypothetical protein